MEEATTYPTVTFDDLRFSRVPGTDHIQIAMAGAENDHYLSVAEFAAVAALLTLPDELRADAG